jgi:histidinol-phosphate phosphatase family protein
MSTFDIKQIAPDWTLFLDRDGVINRRIIDGYVTRPEEFVFLEHVPESIALLSRIFKRIIVVTNQQGIGKGLYSVNDLGQVHAKMKAGVESAGGKINAVYFAPHLQSENSPMRKPGIGMALKAREDFPEIDFSKSIMVGDSASDMEFARAAGMYAVYCGETHSAAANMNFKSLSAFASYLAEHLQQ